MLANKTSPAEKSSLLAVQQPESGTWINALLISQLRLLLNSETVYVFRLVQRWVHKSVNDIYGLRLILQENTCYLAVKVLNADFPSIQEPSCQSYSWQKTWRLDAHTLENMWEFYERPHIIWENWKSPRKTRDHAENHYSGFYYTFCN